MPYRVDWPDAEYHEIIPHLFQGGHDWMEQMRIYDSRYSTVSEDGSWGYVVSMHEAPYANSWPQCDHLQVLFNDTEDALDEDIWKRIYAAVDEAVSRWRRGQKVLIRCQAGYNRSGLVMALILMRLGFTADKAIHQIRFRRGRCSLINRVFERYVHEHEEEYCDPTALGATERLMSEWRSDDDVPAS